MDGWIIVNGWMDRWVDNGYMDEWIIDECMNGKMDTMIIRN